MFAFIGVLGFFAELRSFNDESRFAVHTAEKVIATYRYGELQ